jgi:transposase-like protein
MFEESKDIYEEKTKKTKKDSYTEVSKMWEDSYSKLYKPWFESTEALVKKAFELSKDAAPETYKEF